MKTRLKNISLLLILVTLMTSCVAAVGVRPRHRKHVKVVNKKVNVTPRYSRVAIYKNTNYYRNAGIWYVKKKTKYVTVAAPIGIQVATLPKGYRKVKVRGTTYYNYKGVYYKRSGRKYIVVKV